MNDAAAEQMIGNGAPAARLAIGPGDALPDLTLKLMDDRVVSLRDLVGTPLIIYFYPRDDTPGCTREAQDFSRHLDADAALDGRIIGVSRDTPAKHRKFAAKFALRPLLASDPDNVVIEAFGAWVAKSMYGKRYMGIDRSTFLFDAAGILVQVWRNVKVPAHADEVVQALRKLGGSS